eukprot:5463258-Pleurochrysis_carterae.AAC.1
MKKDGERWREREREGQQSAPASYTAERVQPGERVEAFPLCDLEAPDRSSRADSPTLWSNQRAEDPIARQLCFYAKHVHEHAAT